MNSKEKRKLDKYERELAYMTANAADYPANSRGDKIAKRYAVLIPRVKAAAAAQSGAPAERQQHTSSKRDDLEELKSLLKKLDRAGDALEGEIAGIENLFGVPRNRSEQSILAAARAEYDLSAQYESQLVEGGAPAGFRQKMQTLISRIDAANQAADTALAEGAGATGGLKADLEELAALSRSLNNLNLNLLEDQPAKLAAWLVASHLERDPQPDKTEKKKED